MKIAWAETGGAEIGDRHVDDKSCLTVKFFKKRINFPT